MQSDQYLSATIGQIIWFLLRKCCGDEIYPFNGIFWSTSQWLESSREYQTAFNSGSIWCNTRESYKNTMLKTKSMHKYALLEWCLNSTIWNTDSLLDINYGLTIPGFRVHSLSRLSKASKSKWPKIISQNLCTEFSVLLVLLR